MSATTSGAKSAFGVERAFHAYSGVVVLRGVDFALQPGQVHALLGENGCGKSTLIKILTGALRPTSGQLYLDAAPVIFHNPAQAQAAGVGVVHQNYNVFPDLSVEDNVLGTSPTHVARRRWLLGAVDRRRLRARVEELFDQLQLEVDPAAPVRSLGPAERKFVEVARAMTLRPKFLILDEPTASLEPSAARRVLDLMRTLRSQGVGLAFVSHRLDEVLAVADRYTVLRDGQLVAEGENKELSESDLATMMIGARSQPEPPRSTAASKAAMPVLTLREVRVSPSSLPASIDVYGGEILGVTGLVGSGASDLVRMIGGADPFRGKVNVDGVAVSLATPVDAKRSGIGYIPEDRKAAGLCLEHSVAQNISLASLPAVSRRGIVSFRRMHARAEELRGRLDIRVHDVRQPVASLSGGNQQKVMLAKWLASGIRILAVEEPTQGVDIGGKAQIHALLRQFADSGGTVILASTDVREVVAVCDRVAIFRHGQLQEILLAEQLSEAAITTRGSSDAEQYLAALVDTETTDKSEVRSG